jgi:flagellar biosynthesis/type III secretory pathway protein FliH
MIGMARKKSVKLNIPWELHIALIKLQGRLESTYEEACMKASQLMDTNSTEFEKAVADETRNIEKSQIMTKVNKSRKTWTDKGYKKGYRDGDSQGYQRGVSEYKILYPCSICAEDLVMMPNNQDHKAMKLMMAKAGWAHTTCLEARKKR